MDPSSDLGEANGEFTIDWPDHGAHEAPSVPRPASATDDLGDSGSVSVELRWPGSPPPEPPVHDEPVHEEPVEDEPAARGPTSTEPAQEAGADADAPTPPRSRTQLRIRLRR